MKENIKNFIKNDKTKSFLKITSFVLAFILILEILSGGLFSAINVIGQKSKYSKAYSFMSENENSIDVALVGNSNLYSAFIPTIFWQDYGITSTDISSPHQSPLFSYMVLEELFKTQSPKLVVVETDMFYEGENDDKSYNTNALNKVLSLTNENNFKQIIENKFSIFNFHDNWKNLKFKDLLNLSKNSKSKTIDHGYNYSDNIVKVDYFDYMKYSDEVCKIPVDNLNYIDKIVSLCHKNNAQVLFLSVPSVASWNMQKHNAVNELSNNYNVKFVDLNLENNNLNLDYNYDFRDNGNHLNFYGATKVTTYLSYFINSEFNNLFKDKRYDNNYSSWNEDAKEFYKLYKIKDI